MAPEITKKPNIRKLDRAALREFFKGQSLPAYRGDQIYEWIWQKGVHSFEEMSNLSKSLRSDLENRFHIPTLRPDTLQRSADGTIKFRFELEDGLPVESVLIPVVKENRFTACVSSQVGCSLSCKFCATGQMKTFRNLEPYEIVDQVVTVNAVCEKEYGHRLTNIVFMGMGEPLLNYRRVLDAIDHITAPDELGFSAKRITVSTAGIAKMIRKLADDEVRFNLALSLHASEDEKRNEIMPINETNRLEDLMAALEYFFQKTGNGITYEYIAFQQFNDSIDDAKALAKLCRTFPVKVNIIEYNPVDGLTFEKSGPDRLDAFAGFLAEHGVTVTVRRSRGVDIDAACGQLANKDR